MANTLLTPTVISKEALRQLENNLVMGNNVFRPFETEFKKIGNSLTFRKPVRMSTGDGADITNDIQDVTELQDTITIDKHKHAGWAFSEEDLTLTIEDYSDRYIKPALIQICDDIDRSITELYKNVFFTSGTAATTPATFSALSNLGQKMDDLAIPSEDRMIVTNPAAYWKLADALKGTFEQKGASDFLRRGFLGRIADFDILKSQSIYNHTSGTATATTAVASYTTGDSDITSELTIDTGTGTLVVGDTFTIATVYAVNPVSKQKTEHLMEFTVVDAVSDVSSATLTISPAIRTSGPYQNVDSAPADGDVILVKASHAANLAFHKNAFALVMSPISPFGNGMGMKMSTESYNGYTITVSFFASGEKFKQVCRVDARWGVKCIYPELACRLLG